METLLLYESFYNEIYDSSYGVEFVFIDLDEIDSDDSYIDLSILPLSPSSLCIGPNVGQA